MYDSLVKPTLVLKVAYYAYVILQLEFSDQARCQSALVCARVASAPVIKIRGRQNRRDI